MWNEIKNEIDIENLMREYSGFHDSCIVSVSYHSGAYVDDNGGMADTYGGFEILLHDLLSYLLHSSRQSYSLQYTHLRVQLVFSHSVRHLHSPAYLQSFPFGLSPVISVLSVRISLETVSGDFLIFTAISLSDNLSYIPLSITILSDNVNLLISSAFCRQ